MPPCPPLLECIAAVLDPRSPRGIRHPLPAILALAVAATLCGCCSYTAIAEWGRTHGAHISTALGFRREQPPCAATFCVLFRRLDRAALEACLRRWTTAVLAALPASRRHPQPALAIDGKTLRGSRKRGAPLSHLLSAVSHRLGLAVGQVPVEAKTNEITAIHTLLRGLLLRGWVVTMDALLTQPAIARAILAAGGDYVMIVKGNQPRVHDVIATTFADPVLLGGTSTTATTRTSGHGRQEHRHLVLTSALATFPLRPGQQQAFQVVRTRTQRRTGVVTQETIYGLTSLPPRRANAAQILAYLRGHWTIENRSHYVRDVTFDEDHSQVRTGSIPQVMAACRNTAIGLLRLAGHHHIAQATRRYAAKPWDALALLGIPSPTFK